MRLIRSVILIGGVAGTVSAQATTRPTTAVAGTVVRTAGADLVIDSLDLVLSPNPFGSAEVDANGVKVKGLIMMVARVTNRGTERWAAPRGKIGFTLSAGREEDTPARRGASGGVSTVPGQTSTLGRTIMAPFGPFNGNAPIPGSLAPGESRVISLVVRNRADRAFVIFERDKYYTLTATLRTQGDVNEANDRSRRVRRFDAARDRLVRQWEPLVVLSLPRGGTVEVVAPPRPPRP